MKKRLLSTLLALCMALALVPGTALAAEEEEEWSYTYPVTGGNIYLEYGFDKESGYVYHVYDCDESVTEAVIPSQVDGHTITHIGWDAFADCTNLVSVVLPDTIEGICEGAFAGCTALVSVTIPASVIYISGSDVFRGCNSLTNITVAEENTAYTVENFALFNKDKATLICCPAASGSYNVPEGVVHIDYGAFQECAGLESVVFPETLVDIGKHAFQNCTNLKSIVFSDSITKIESEAFAGCAALTSIVLPSSLTTLHAYAFSKCTGLTSVTIPSSVTSMGAGIVGAPGGVRDDPFDKCDNLTDVYYAGSEEQWNKICTWEMTATIHYNSTGPDEPEPDTPEPSGSAFTFEFEFGGLDPQTGNLKMSIVVYMNGIELLTIPLTLHLG